MFASRRSRLALLSVFATFTAAAATAPGASAAAQRYASPGGAGIACSAASPCTITQSIVKVRVSRAGRRLFAHARRLSGMAANAAHSGTGQSKTTIAAVTIRRRNP